MILSSDLLFSTVNAIVDEVGEIIFHQKTSSRPLCKVFARVLLSRLNCELLAENFYPESQCGLRASRSTSDMIFSLRLLKEKCAQKSLPLHISFVDLAKAFDTVNRQAPMDMLLYTGAPAKLVKLIDSLHEGTKGKVRFNATRQIRSML